MVMYLKSFVLVISTQQLLSCSVNIRKSSSPDPSLWQKTLLKKKKKIFNIAYQDYKWKCSSIESVILLAAVRLLLYLEERDGYTDKDAESDHI